MRQQTFAQTEPVLYGYAPPTTGPYPRNHLSCDAGVFRVSAPPLPSPRKLLARSWRTSSPSCVPKTRPPENKAKMTTRVTCNERPKKVERDRALPRHTIAAVRTAAGGGGPDTLDLFFFFFSNFFIIIRAPLFPTRRTTHAPCLSQGIERTGNHT